jgi:diaminohydroxyphosphoribosylaminopyrimidine deaminase / 5-amino-6-(5-phosphoribosylamino)uracil reductase
LRAYIWHRTEGRPFVVLKAAMSIDGAVGCGDGSSRWITGETAREHAHILRASSQAIMVGSATALIDKPSLTVRGVVGAETVKPLRVVADTRGRVDEGPLMDTRLAPTLMCTGPDVPEETLRKWSSCDVDRLVCPLTEDGVVSLGYVLEELGRRGVMQLMVEGMYVACVCARARKLSKMHPPLPPPPPVGGGRGEGERNHRQQFAPKVFPSPFRV